MFKAEFVTLVSLKVPSGSDPVREEIVALERGFKSLWKRTLRRSQRSKGFIMA